MVDRTRLLVFIVLAKTLIASRPYDPRGAFVLLHSIDEDADIALSGVNARAMQANMVAALDDDGQAHDHARVALADVVADLERRRRTPSPAR